MIVTKNNFFELCEEVHKRYCYSALFGIPAKRKMPKAKQLLQLMLLKYTLQKFQAYFSTEPPTFTVSQRKRLLHKLQNLNQ